MLMQNYFLQVFTEKKSIERVDVYVKSLACSLKSVVLQPSSKSGIHSKFSDLISNNTNALARWTLHVLTPENLLKPKVEVIMNALRVWEAQWSESKLRVVSKLTAQEFSDMFLGTRTVLQSIQTVQGLIKVF